VKCYGCGKTGHFRRDCKSKTAKRAATSAEQSVAMVALHGPVAEDVAGKRAADDRIAGERMEWILDSGASAHICNDVTVVRDNKPTRQKVAMVDGTAVAADGVCTIDVATLVDGKTVSSTLHDVLLVPSAPLNLLSQNAVQDRGIRVNARDKITRLLKDNRVVAVARREQRLSGLPMIEVWARKTDVAAVAVAAPRRRLNEAQLWHQRFGHLSYVTLAKIAKHKAVKGLPVSEKAFCSMAAQVCDACVMAKQVTGSHLQSLSRAAQPPALVHSDLMGPFEVELAGGNKYVLTAIDDFSGKAAVKPLKHKSQVSAELKVILLAWEGETDLKLKKVCTDKSTEYNEFDAWCASQGIKRDKSVAYTVQQNGHAERFNRTITERVRAMLNSSGVAKKYWAEAFAAAVDVYNMSPRQGNVKTPYELFCGAKPDVRGLRTFGCEVFCRKQPVALTKFGERSNHGRLMGGEPGTKGWRVLLDAGNVVVRYDCVFVEYAAEDDDSESDNDSMDDNAGSTAPAAGENVDAAGAAAADADVGAGGAVEKSPKRLLPPRLREPSKRMRDSYALLCQIDTSQDEPPTLQQALAQVDGDMWRQAADDELRSLRELGVYELVEKPRGVNLLKNKWVLKKKRDQAGNIERYKARLVAKGFTHREGIDYEETFAPVARHATMRALLAKAAVEDLEVEQIDAKTAFLNGPLKETIYMEPPAGYDCGDKVLLLKKALYSLKQAARAWNEELKRQLLTENIIISSADASLFYLEREGRRCFLLIYVDDGLLVGIKEDVAALMRALEYFDLRKLGPVAFFLSMEIIRDRKAKMLMVTQRKYAHEILQQTSMEDCKGKSAPMEQNLKLSKHGDDLMADAGCYAETVGMLFYLATCTRPDIAYAVGVLARFISKPRQKHWVRVKGVLQYLKQTADYGIIYGLEDALLEGYTDSDYAADPDKRRSTGGYVFLLAGGAISWGSKLLPTVATSIMEAEYMANGNGAKEALWLRKVMETLYGVTVSVQIYCDNVGALAQMHNPVGHQKAKHIDVLHHFLRGRVARGEVKVEYVATENMVADLLTKALGKQQHEKFSKAMGLTSVQL
jgi:transposase InsO family protein